MTKIWRETGFVENDPWIIETDEVKATIILPGTPNG